MINYNSTSSIPFNFEGHPLPYQPISNYLDGSVLEDCIRRLNENAFNLLLPCLPGEPDLLRLCSLACKYGLASCLERLLSTKGGSSVDMVTPLRRASINGRNGCLEVVVRHRGPGVLTRGFHCSPLELAVEEGHLATVRLLVRLGGKEVVEQAGRAERDRMDRIMPKEVRVFFSLDSDHPGVVAGRKVDKPGSPEGGGEGLVEGLEAGASGRRNRHLGTGEVHNMHGPSDQHPEV